MQSLKLLLALLIAVSSSVSVQAARSKTVGGIKKLKDVIIYKDEKFYSSFPSIVRRPSGELVLAFRRAPERRLMGAAGYSHTDPNAYLMLVRSKDGGSTWTQPELLYAHPLGGSQDPCMLQLHDGTIVCSSYLWTQTPAKAPKSKSIFYHGDYAFMGGYILRSRDGGRTWQDPVIPPPAPGEKMVDVYGKPLPAYNRGAMCEGRDGRLFWVTAANDFTAKRNTSTHLMISADEGKTWQYSCPVAKDPRVSFSETSLYETPRGTLVAFMRTADFDDHTAVARSFDGGRSFQRWEDAGFQGHPHYALRLPDNRVLLVYGYRHSPYGIRARLLDPECTNLGTAPELVLRDDGGSSDIGYPWATMLSKNRALVVYYFNTDEGTRFIGGTILQIQ